MPSEGKRTHYTIIFPHRQAELARGCPGNGPDVTLEPLLPVSRPFGPAIRFAWEPSQINATGPR